MSGTAILSGQGPETEALTDDGNAEHPPAGPRLARAVGLAGIVLLALPFVAVIILSLTRPWWPSGDVALMEIRTFDVGGEHNPLLGVYSRFGWYHPGPLAYWVLALPYRLLGSRPAGMLVGTALVHGAAVAGCIVLAWRRGGRVLAMLAALLLALVIVGLGVEHLVYYWNPYLPLFAVAFLILATWSVLDGDIQLVPLVVAVSCFSWQAHFGYLGVTGALTGIAVLGAVVLVVRDLRSDSPARYRPRSLVLLAVLTALAGGICLAPVLVEQLTHDPGNVSLVMQSLSDNREKTIGLDRAAGIIGAHVSPAGIWITGARAADVSLGPAGALRLALPVVALGATMVLAARAGRWSAVRFGAVTAVSALAGLMAVARTVGAPYPYLGDWMRPVAMLLWLSVAWSLICVARSRGWFDAGAGARLVPVAAVVVALATAGAAVRSVTGGALHLPDEALSEPVDALGDGTVRALAGQPLVRLRAGGGWCAGELAHGLAVRLVESGTDIVVDADLYPLEYGRGRVRGDAVPAVELICGADAGDRVARSEVAPIATANLFSAAELDEYRAVRGELQARLQARGRADVAAGVENPLVAASVLLVSSGDPADRELADRFESFLERGNRGGAVFYWPDGRPRAPG